MKFEKFFKAVGTHGAIVKTVNDRWLVCEGVGMKIPARVNTFGVASDPDDMFPMILSADLESDVMDLVRAEIPADGKPNNITRIFADEIGDEVVISNANYGLLEKSDRIVYLEITDENEIDHKFILITDIKGENLIGFISGKNN